LLLVAVFVAGAISRDWLAADDETRDGASHHLPPARVATDAAAMAPGRQSSPAAPQPLRSSEHLETALLPLLKDIVPLPPDLGLRPGNGGGMVVVGDMIIVVDIYGKFAIAADKGSRFERLVLPDLPNNAADYDRLAAPLRKIEPGFDVNGGFVVHNVEYRSEAAGGIRLFVSYEKFLSEPGTTALSVSSIRLDERFKPSGPWEDVYQSLPLRADWYSGVAGGGRMLVRGDDLLVTVGDYNQDGVFMSSRLEAQDPATDFGKILSIDLKTKAKTIVSMGHRNPQGLAITSGGTIYATEHGPRGGDRLTRVVPGANFGWPIVTLGTHYSSYQWPNRDADAHGAIFSQPTYAWVPSIGVSNLIEAAGFNPAWNKDLLVASLKARSLYRLRLDGEDRVVYSEPIWIGERLRDIKTLSDGTLVLLTDSAKLIFLSVDETTLATNKREWPPTIRPPQTGCPGCH
jgi:hypothetical protein